MKIAVISFGMSFLGLLIHTGVNIKNNLDKNEKIMDSTVVEMNEDFPLVFKIRAIPYQNTSFLKDQCYHDVEQYFTGFNYYTFIGWAGHSFESNKYNTNLENIESFSRHAFPIYTSNKITSSLK